jgi:hypothetical protein
VSTDNLEIACVHRASEFAIKPAGRYDIHPGIKLYWRGRVGYQTAAIRGDVSLLSLSIDLRSLATLHHRIARPLVLKRATRTHDKHCQAKLR